MWGDCDLSNDLDNYGGDIIIYGNVHGADIIYQTTGSIAIWGTCQLAQNIVQAGAGSIYLYGRCELGGNLTNSSTGVIYIYGTLDVHNITNAAGGTISIEGVATIRGTITNAGTLTYQLDTGEADDAATSDDLSDITTTALNSKVRRLLLRLSSDAFTATIQGAARTELDTMLAQLATYVSAAGAAYSATVDPGGSARTNIEQTLEDLGKILAGAGITTFPAAAVPADGVSMAAVLRKIYDLIDALPVFTETGGTITTDGTEQTIWTVDAPASIFKPLVFVADLTANTVTESIVIKFWNRVKSGGGYVEDFAKRITVTLAVGTGVSVVLSPNRYGVKITIEKTAGTNRAYDWEVFYES